VNSDIKIINTRQIYIAFKVACETYDVFYTNSV